MKQYFLWGAIIGGVVYGANLTFGLLIDFPLRLLYAWNPLALFLFAYCWNYAVTPVGLFNVCGAAGTVIIVGVIPGALIGWLVYFCKKKLMKLKESRR